MNTRPRGPRGPGDARQKASERERASDERARASDASGSLAVVVDFALPGLPVGDVCPAQEADLG
eukprot:6941539-Pyramimonas_sp.AAC.1